MERPWKQVAQSVLERFEHRGSSFSDSFIKPSLTTPTREPVPLGTLLEPSARAVILGSPGAGKTTLLQYLASVRAQHYLDRTSGVCPLFVSARELAPEGSLLVGLAKNLSLHLLREIPPFEIANLFQRGDAALIVDGLDEIEPRVATDFVRVLQDFSELYPTISLVVSCRFAGSELFFLPGLRFLHLADLDQKQIGALIRSHAQGEAGIAEEFTAAIAQDTGLVALARNPLLLTLLLHVFRARRKLPTSRAAIYADIVDYLLRQWCARNAHAAQTVAVGKIHEFLEIVALSIYERGQFSISFEEFAALRDHLFPHGGVSRLDFETAVAHLDQSGLIHKAESGELTFTHLTFLEYFVASAIRRDPKRMANLPSNSLGSREIVIFASGLVNDITEIVEALMKRGDLLLAARCISNSRAKNNALVLRVIREIANEVGDPFVHTFADFMHAQSASKSEPPRNVYAELLGKWNRCFDPVLAAHEKGKEFEHFAIQFFSQMFKIVAHDLNTEDGEIDLIAEISSMVPFWNEFGADVLIECKNWGAHVPLKEVGAFINKVQQKRVKLGLFVSVSGFTSDAMRTLKNHCSNVSAPLVVPIEGAEIKNMLLRQELFDEFLKGQIRDFKYLRKY